MMTTKHSQQERKMKRKSSKVKTDASSSSALKLKDDDAAVVTTCTGRKRKQRRSPPETIMAMPMELADTVGEQQQQERGLLGTKTEVTKVKQHDLVAIAKATKKRRRNSSLNPGSWWWLLAPDGNHAMGKSTSNGGAATKKSENRVTTVGTVTPPASPPASPPPTPPTTKITKPTQIPIIGNTSQIRVRESEPIRWHWLLDQDGNYATMTKTKKSTANNSSGVQVATRKRGQHGTKPQQQSSATPSGLNGKENRSPVANAKDTAKNEKRIRHRRPTRASTIAVDYAESESDNEIAEGKQKQNEKESDNIVPSEKDGDDYDDSDSEIDGEGDNEEYVPEDQKCAASSSNPRSRSPSLVTAAATATRGKRTKKSLHKVTPLARKSPSCRESKKRRKRINPLSECRPRRRNIVIDDISLSSDYFDSDSSIDNDSREAVVASTKIATRKCPNEVAPVQSFRQSSRKKRPVSYDEENLPEDVVSYEEEDFSEGDENCNVEEEPNDDGVEFQNNPALEAKLPAKGKKPSSNRSKNTSKNSNGPIANVVTTAAARGKRNEKEQPTEVAVPARRSLRQPFTEEHFRSFESWNGSILGWEEMCQHLHTYRKLQERRKIQKRSQLLPERSSKYRCLGVWARKQCKNYCEGLLSREQTRLLGEITNTWWEGDPCYETLLWSEMFHRLELYKKKHGTASVPYYWKQDAELGIWVGAQRRLFTEELRSKFPKTAANRWEKVHKQLVVRREIHNNGISDDDKTTDDSKNRNGSSDARFENDPQLWLWLSSQNIECRVIDRIDLLDSIGFEWDTQRNQWLELYQRLKEYDRINGNTCVPTHSESFPELGEFVFFQRQECREDYRRRLLDEIGFVWEFDWDNSQKYWMETYRRLVWYCKSVGNACVPPQWEHDPELGEFVRRQRLECSNPDNIDKLNEINFNWDCSEATPCAHCKKGWVVKVVGQNLRLR